MAKTRCYARCHMTMEEYGLWQYACEVSHKSGKFYLSGPKVAIEYRDTDKSTVYRVGKKLIAAGWFRLIEPRRRDPKTGLWKPPVVKPLRPLSLFTFGEGGQERTGTSGQPTTNKP